MRCPNQWTFIVDFIGVKFSTSCPEASRSMDLYCGFHRGEVFPEAVPKSPHQWTFIVDFIGERFSQKLSRRVPSNGSDLDTMSEDHASPAERSQGHARLRFAVSWGRTVRRSRARTYCPTLPTSGFNSCAASGRVVPQPWFPTVAPKGANAHKIV